MTNKDLSLQAKKHEMSVRSMYFSRYLMIRYFSAAYLFTNLFWLIFAICYRDLIASFLAGGLFISLLIGSIEQASKWHRRDTNLKYTSFYYTMQLVLNVVFASLCYTSVGKIIFPFITSSSVTNVIFTILLIGIVGCLIVLKRINNLQNGRDKYLRAINAFENNQQ